MPAGVRVMMFTATRTDGRYEDVPEVGEEYTSKAIDALQQSMRGYLEMIDKAIGDDELITHALEVAESAGMTDVGGDMRLSKFEGDSGTSYLLQLVIERVEASE